jgi:formamidopyrimidine-DNA glycosylase
VPELPEVEVVRRGVARFVDGRRIADVEVLHPRAIRRHLPGETDLCTRLRGRTFGAPARRGKFLWIPVHPSRDLELDSLSTPQSADEAQDHEDGGGDEALVVHLGMSGQLLVQEPGTPDEKHLRVRLTFDDGGPEVRFVDQRTFGGVALEPVDDDGVPAPVAHIARDPFDPAFDDAAFARALRARRTGLKRALLDQTLVSGIGNIYADEALWRARLHYARATEGITRAEAQAVLDAARTVMSAALDVGGTSFDSLYVNVNGQSGYFDRSLEAYGQEGQPCSRCATPMRRESFMNRSSYLCPTCQRRPRNGRW